MRPLSLRLLTAALLGLPVAAGAQGTLSTQGLGYPGGQLSTRSLATGGALGEVDPYSAINPSSIFGLGGSTLYFQAEPEYRTLHSGASSERSTIARYPLVSASVPLAPSWMAGIGVSNLLDRSFKTVTRSIQTAGTTTVGSTNTFSSDGAIGDVRLALAWAPQSWLRVGVAGHAITGDNRLNSTQVFDDTTFAALSDTTTVTYVGSAYSAGFQIQAPAGLALAASYRRGGALSVKHADTTLRTGNVPDRIGLSAAYVGVRGTTIAVRTAKDKWSNMSGLVSPGTPISESWDTSVGADVPGPSLFGNYLQLRAGGRQRTLPFGVPAQFTGGGTVLLRPASEVKERSYAFGVGTLLARGRATLDVTGNHASRTSPGIGLTESAWTLSVGIMVRP
jgi:hypothetical protein